jgi:hypothetical protein
MRLVGLRSMSEMVFSHFYIASSAEASLVSHQASRGTHLFPYIHASGMLAFDSVRIAPNGISERTREEP